MFKIGIIGAGAMGSGIAQVVAMAGHQVTLVDSFENALEKSAKTLLTTLQKLEGKGKIANATAIFSCISFEKDISQLIDCQLLIEAIVENLDVKKKLFSDLEKIVTKDCILASNTSSLSITAIASACQYPQRVVGIHFFNPAPLMALVELIPAIQTDGKVVETTKKLLTSWKKTTVICQDTPAFIVNRIARPFYSEALRIFEEGIATMETIDWVMREKAGFKMGPFELMDFIGHDVNFRVTESVFTAFYFDNRYKPSFTQKRLLDAGWFGKKSGRGFYDYSENAIQNLPTTNDANLTLLISERILVMLFNEAADALFWNVASAEDIDIAMTKGVNYPKGLLAWAHEYGIEKVVQQIDVLYDFYHDERYRCSPLLRKLTINNQ